MLNPGSLDLPTCSCQRRTSQLKPGSNKLELAEAKLLKIKDNTKFMLEGKKSAQLKMKELKLKIVEESKAMKGGD